MVDGVISMALSMPTKQFLKLGSRRNVMTEQLNTEDFFVQIRPQLTDTNEWTGAVDVNVVTMPDNPLNDVDYYSLLNLAKLVCSTIPVMEEDDEFRVKLEHWLEQYENSGGDFADDKRLSVKGEEGNVVYLDFLTETEGSA